MAPRLRIEPEAGRQEGAEETEATREIALIPPEQQAAFDEYDAQTAALMCRLEALERRPHGERVTRLVGEWDWIEKMKGYEEKQRFLEPLICAVQRRPEENEDLLIFLMLVFEPVRRWVSKIFINVHSGLQPVQKDLKWSNREELRLIEHVERQDLFDVTREAALEALYQFPSPAPDHFFRWLREAIAHRALNKLRGDLPHAATSKLVREEAEAMQMALAGLERIDGPTKADRGGMREWRSHIRMRDVFDVVEDFFKNADVRDACKSAVGRLPERQREVINGYFFEELKVPTIAARRGISQSTVYNQKRDAEGNLHDDDLFFSSLLGLKRVRDRARAEALTAKYPDGVYPGGKRIVHIDAA